MMRRLTMLSKHAPGNVYSLVRAKSDRQLYLTSSDELYLEEQEAASSMGNRAESVSFISNLIAAESTLEMSLDVEAAAKQNRII
jgi:hypothetical protein